MATPLTSTPLSETSTCTNTGTSRSKRILPLSPDVSRESENRRKASKVSRACDHCKLKKLKCSGTIPCDGCTKRNVNCQYDSAYRRGRPPTPPTVGRQRHSMSSAASTVRPTNPVGENTEVITTRSSSQGPSGLETAEIEGQFFDPTSNLTFIHRAWKRLAQQNQQTDSGLLTGSENLQPLMSAGDVPFTTKGDQSLLIVSQPAALELFTYYFENCVVTYRILNHQYCRSWFDTVINNWHNGQPLETEIGHAKAAIILSILAIASFRQHRITEQRSMPGISLLSQQSEQYFLAASDLTAQETGLPRLESAQARVLQVLYLLQTSRMNQAWYVFGNTVPIVTALGLHRKSNHYRNGGRQPTDYIISECRKRTFWVLYTLDKYLAVVFGRPRFYHDNDTDQDFPDRVNDEDMTPQGPSLAEPAMDCHVDAVIFHARYENAVLTSSLHLTFFQDSYNYRKCVSPSLLTQEDAIGGTSRGRARLYTTTSRMETGSSTSFQHCPSLKSHTNILSTIHSLEACLLPRCDAHHPTVPPRSFGKLQSSPTGVCNTMHKRG